MKYFIETKRIGLQIISIGIVSEDDRYYYAVSTEFSLEKAVKDRVLVSEVFMPMIKNMSSGMLSSGDVKDDISNLRSGIGKSKEVIKREIETFLSAESKTKMEIWSYNANVNGVVFNELMDGDVPFCRNLEQMMDDKLYNTPFYEHAENGMIDAWFGWEKPEEALSMVRLYDDYPKRDENRDALADALWNKGLHTFINALGQH